MKREHRALFNKWQREAGDAEAWSVRDALPPIEDDKEVHGLWDHLASVAPRRRRPDGEELAGEYEYLLYRGMSAEEYEATVGSGFYRGVSHCSSWTPFLKIAGSFATRYMRNSESGAVCGYVVAAWIPMSAVRTLPGLAMKKLYSDESEVIVNPDYSCTVKEVITSDEFWKMFPDFGR